MPTSCPFYHLLKNLLLVAPKSSPNFLPNKMQKQFQYQEKNSMFNFVLSSDHAHIEACTSSIGLPSKMLLITNHISFSHDSTSCHDLGMTKPW